MPSGSAEIRAAEPLPEPPASPPVAHQREDRHPTAYRITPETTPSFWLGSPNVRKVDHCLGYPKRNPSVVGLLGAYSNPEIQGRLRRLSEELEWLADRKDAPKPSARPDRKLRNGLVPRAIEKVLADAAEPMRVRDIHDAVEDLLGISVPVPSVNCWLTKNARDKESHVVRLGYGRYHVVRTPL